MKQKIAFLFPGQGAQYITMAQDFIEQDPQLQTILADFDAKNKTNLAEIMANGPAEKLQETKFTQPAILFHSIAALRALQKQIELTPDYVAGHSLGEFSALVANGVLDFSDALYLVHKRGEFMIKANDGTPFAMAAIIGPDEDTVRNLCQQASEEGVVVAANFNTPVQTVISGSKAGVDKACELLSEAGAKRVVPLVVGGPFHSPLIQKAGEWLSQEMKQIQFNSTKIPVVCNVDAEFVTDPEAIKQNLARQVTSSVLWVDSINKMIAAGVELFIEFGPQKVLSGMMRKINRQVKILHIDKAEDLQKVIDYLKQ
ncbi:MAG: ACP S-malonyltransferase [Candidatus Cloacimonadales bacterium]